MYVGLRKEETIEEAMNGTELMRRQRGKAGTSGGVKGGASGGAGRRLAQGPSRRCKYVRNGEPASLNTVAVVSRPLYLAVRVCGAAGRGRACESATPEHGV